MAQNNKDHFVTINNFVNEYKSIPEEEAEHRHELYLKITYSLLEKDVVDYYSYTIVKDINKKSDAMQNDDQDCGESNSFNDKKKKSGAYLANKADIDFIYLDVIDEALKKYTPENVKKASFTTYFRSILYYRYLDYLKKQERLLLRGNTVIDSNGKETSFNSLQLERISNNDSTDEIVDDNQTEHLMLVILQGVIEIFGGISPGKTKFICYKMLFTSKMVTLIKNEPSVNSVVMLSLKSREKELFSCLETELINYTYTILVKSISDIHYGKLKKYSELPNIRKKKRIDDEIKLPYIAILLIDYYETYYKKPLSNQSLSEYKKALDKSLAQLIKNTY